MKIDKSNVVIIIPSYNEGRRIELVVKSILEKGYNNIVVIDDGSTDHSIELIKKYETTILTHVVNRGAGAATETGLYYCREVLQANHVVMIDADTQHDVNDIDKLLLEHIKQKADITIGNRFMDNEDHIPMKNRIFNQIANLITSVFAGQRVYDSQSGFKVFNRKALNCIFIEHDLYEHCSEIFIKAHSHKLKVIDVSIQVYYPDEIKNKGQHFMSGIRTFFNLLYSVLFKTRNNEN